MAMPGSGAISFLQLQNEFGGANPISISEYYRGALVPATNTTTNAQWVGYSYSASYSVIRYSAGIYGPLDQWTFGGTQIYFAGGPLNSIVVSGVSYYVGTYSGIQTYTAADPKTNSPAYYTTYYGIQRYENVSTTSNVNTGVPANILTGTISMSQFYGAQDY